MMRAKLPKLKGFGVVTRQGHFLWHYTRPDEDETRQLYQQHNPEVKGHPDGHKIIKVKLTFEE